MSVHHARRTIAVDVATLYTELCKVERWPEFMDGLREVTPLGYNRYRWTICFAGRAHDRELDVVLSTDPRAHRIAWRRLTKPAFDGTFRLEPASDARTVVHLDMTPTPNGMLEGLYDVAHADHWDASADLWRLAEMLTGRAATADEDAHAEETSPR